MQGVRRLCDGCSSDNDATKNIPHSETSSYLTLCISVCGRLTLTQPLFLLSRNTANGHLVERRRLVVAAALGCGRLLPGLVQIVRNDDGRQWGGIPEYQSMCLCVCVCVCVRLMTPLGADLFCD